jgi:cation transport ATPase
MAGRTRCTPGAGRSEPVDGISASLDKSAEAPIVTGIMKQDIESRFSLLVTISLFFPVLMYNLSAVAGQPAEKGSLLLMQTSAVVGLYLIDYILFQVRKNALSAHSLKRINVVLLVALGTFIVPVLGLTALAFAPPLWVAVPIMWLSVTAMPFVLFVPPVVEVAVLFLSDGKK